jgi:hypothetical protein
MFCRVFKILLLVLFFGVKAEALPKKSSLILRVIVTGRQTNFPVYNAKVSFVTFAGSFKGITDSKGTVQKDIPANSKLALSISAEGYAPTTTRSFKMTKTKSMQVKMRLKKNGEPLATPTPTFRPTNTPSYPTPWPSPTPNSFRTPTPGPTPNDGNLPVITGQPRSLAASQYQYVTLNILAVSSEPITYQWYRAGAPISGATSPSLRVQATTTYSNVKYYCAVTNSYGTVLSNGVQVYVYIPLLPG